MAVDYRFKFPLPNGLHARPASHFEAVTSRFRSKITLISERTRVHANARSVLSMVSADVKFDDPCCIEVDGDDEQPALDAVRRFVHDELPNCDHQLPELPAEISDLRLPRSLSAAGLEQFVRGRAVCSGVGWGQVVVIGGMEIPPGLENERATDLVFEKKRAGDAIARVAEQISAKIDSATVPHEAEVLRAHLSIVRDVALEEAINSLIVSNRRTAAQAMVEACRKFSETLRVSDSAYLRERILDIEDVCLQLLDQVVHRDRRTSGPVLLAPSVCVADHLTPGQLLGLNRKFLRGLVLTEGGTTSHTVILARSMNVPTLVGVAHATTSVRSGTEAIVDGELGLLVTEISEPVRRYYTMEQDRLDRWNRQLDVYRSLDGMTGDGHAMEVGANIASAEEASAAFQNGAQGIGLFRTEMLFMDRNSAPSEQEQTQIYTAAVAAGQGRPVIIRLLDIGGDKPAPYLKLPAEDNPFLGYRGARLYKEFSSLVKSQLRAILRAHAAGNVKILVPMICCLEEVREIRQMLVECAAELKEGGLDLGPLPPLGVMIEVPSLAFLMPELCKEVDFFSIGSNDLTQYFLATDRANQKIASLYTWSHPAFLRLMNSVIDAAKLHGKWIGLCGELGDQPAALPLLIGLGLDEISVSPARISTVKAAVSKLQMTHCKNLVNQVLSCGTRGEVEALVQHAGSAAATLPILSKDLIVTVDCRTKEEVIKCVSDQLFLAGRTCDPKAVEQAIWKREETYSTGFGFGFALPHCKSDHLDANSIVIAKLQSPVEWVSLDSKPVDLVILLAIRGQAPAREHMKTFARLSRLVMREEFRDHLRSETDPARLVEFLDSSLTQDAPTQ
jgi:phosphoenolpyruvate-protein phosphotransferase